jgi:hypothetical protein
MDFICFGKEIDPKKINFDLFSKLNNVLSRQKNEDKGNGVAYFSLTGIFRKMNIETKNGTIKSNKYLLFIACYELISQ